MSNLKGVAKPVLKIQECGLYEISVGAAPNDPMGIKACAQVVCEDLVGAFQMAEHLADKVSAEYVLDVRLVRSPVLVLR